jgi:allantoinase
VDVGFWGGVVPGNAAELDALVDAGVRGFKCFLVPSGVEEFPAVDEDDLRKALPILARRRVPLLVHAESPALIGSPERLALHGEGSERLRHYLATRPGSGPSHLADGPARRRVLNAGPHRPRLVGRRRCRDRERQGGLVPVTAETCPHYLDVRAGEIPDGATEFMRAADCDASHRDASGPGSRTDMIVTDHRLRLPRSDPGRFRPRVGGIASLELSLLAVWTPPGGCGAGGPRGSRCKARHTWPTSPAG